MQWLFYNGLLLSLTLLQSVIHTAARIMFYNDNSQHGTPLKQSVASYGSWNKIQTLCDLRGSWTSGCFHFSYGWIPQNSLHPSPQTFFCSSNVPRNPSPKPLHGCHMHIIHISIQTYHLQQIRHNGSFFL